MSTVIKGSLAVPTLDHLLSAEPQSLLEEFSDIAAVNLACARGLNNVDEHAFPDYLSLLDKIAEAVAKETDRCFRLFKLKPAQFNHSEAVFRIYTMEHVFRVQFNIKYDPLIQKSLESGFQWKSSDSTEVFIHGVLSDKRTGTCSSLPTVAIAVGRRLGYPLKLVLVPNHTLYRWDDGDDRHNYQHTESGGDIRSDDYFFSWPRSWTEYDYTINRQTNVWLHSMNATQEVSKFLCNRAIMLCDAERFDEAMQSIEASQRFDPINPACRHIALNIVDQMQQTRRRDQTKPWKELVHASAIPLPTELLGVIDSLAASIGRFETDVKFKHPVDQIMNEHEPDYRHSQENK